MDFSIVFLIIGFFIFLFSMYVLSYEDLVIQRKNMSLEQVFNLSFLLAIVSLFFARVFFVLFHFAKGYLNLLVFFVFPYFPGLSIGGALLGEMLFVLYLVRKRRVPSGRLFDFFSISFLWGYSLSAFLYENFLVMFAKKPFHFWAILAALLLCLFNSILLKILLPIQRRGELKDGSIGFLSISFFSVVQFLFGIFEKKEKSNGILSGEEVLFMVIFVVSVALLAKQEKLWSKMRKRYGY